MPAIWTRKGTRPVSEWSARWASRAWKAAWRAASARPLLARNIERRRRWEGEGGDDGVDWEEAGETMMRIWICGGSAWGGSGRSERDGGLSKAGMMKRFRGDARNRVPQTGG